MKRAISVMGSLMLSLAACDGSTPPDGDAGGGGGDSGAVVDSGAEADAPSSGPATHDCEEADFVDLTAGDADSRMIMVPSGTSTFDQPCITIRAGQSVMFMWDFAAHPLEAGVAPGHPGESTEPTPIEPQTTGSLYTVAFPTAGDYAYYCTVHFHSTGMYGVVRVVP
jgi:plastocyanin